MNTLTMTDPEGGDAAHEAEARKWLVRLRSGEATPADIEAFRRWCDEHPRHAHMVSALGDMWIGLGAAMNEIARDDPETARAWRDGEVSAVAARVSRSGLRSGVRPVSRPARRAFVGFAVAAGASWLAVRPPLHLWPALGDFLVDYHTGTGEQREVKLSDRVAIEMNTQTRVNILRTGAAQHGVELVAGEAEIVAAPSVAGRTAPLMPVVVRAGRAQMSADVARFDVRQLGDETCVTCVSGSVRVEHPQRRFTLQAAQQVVYRSNAVDPVSTTDPRVVTGWRRGVLVFRGTPLSEVVDEINRYRPGKVILRNAALGENRVDAQIPIAQLDDAVNLLGKAYGAHIVRLPGDIALLG
ncbi:MAG TPA: FecR domain-containing protein [Paraburkholderia sp.]